VCLHSLSLLQRHSGRDFIEMIRVISSSRFAIFRGSPSLRRASEQLETTRKKQGSRSLSRGRSLAAAINNGLPNTRNKELRSLCHSLPARHIYTAAPTQSSNRPITRSSAVVSDGMPFSISKSILITNSTHVIQAEGCPDRQRRRSNGEH
jgi:hypothetical protein